MAENLAEMATNNGAAFSPCKRYRYALWREATEAGPFVTFIGLNPSTADETVDDPTIRRCRAFAKAWGFQGIRMLNLFAFRATEPSNMKALGVAAIGPANDQALLRYLSDPRSRLTVACWGSHGAHLSRGWEVRRKLLAGYEMKCFGLTANKQPLHPLYQPATAELVEF